MMEALGELLGFQAELPPKLPEGRAVVPDEEEDNRDGCSSCQQERGQGDPGINHGTLPDMQPGDHNQDEEGQHAPKIELVHHLLRVMPASGIKMEGGSVTHQVQKHKGDGKQEVLL